MQIDVVTPGGVILEGETTQVTVPTELGEMSILEGHIPVISSLALGLMQISLAGEEHFFAVDGGFIEVAKTRINIVTETALKPGDIDVASEERNLVDAKAALENMSALSPAEIVNQNRALRRSESFIQIAKL